MRLLQDDLYFGFNELLDRYIHAIRYDSQLPVSAADGYRVFESAYDVIEFDQQNPLVADSHSPAGSSR